MSVISLAQAKEYLKIDYDDQDTVIQMMIDGAEEWLERFCGISFSTSDYAENIFSEGGYNLWPKYRPVNSITSVAYNGATVDTDDYVLDGNSIRRVGNRRWKEYYQYTVRYNAGYSTVPAGLKMVILQLIAKAFLNVGGRESEQSENWSVSWDNLIDGQIRQMIQPYMSGRVLS